MKQYEVTGMTCAACVARVEKAVNKVPGVTSCAVSLLTNSMGVEGSAAPEAIIKAVTSAGYGAAEKGNALQGSAQSGRSQASSAEADSLADRQTPLLKKRLISSLVFLLILMYFSMGHVMWNWPVPALFRNNPVAIGILELLLCGIVMVINQRFFISGFTSLWHRSPNMDTLVALGSASGFCWSVVVLLSLTAHAGAADHSMHMMGAHDFYFESSAMILTLITVGKMLEARSKGKTTDALKALMKLAPKNATIVRDGLEEIVAAEMVNRGDVFVVRPGESIPVDGIVLEGSSAVNEAALTGESIPVDKASGDHVSAATINQSGFLKCEATRVGEDTTLSQIIRMVSDAAATKAPIAKIADRVAGVFVPAVIGIALLTMLVWLFLGRDFAYSLARGISVLVISCPCALGLATPVAIMVGNGVGARNGILFKTAVSLEETGKASIVVLDKTGTITTGSPVVTDFFPAPDCDRDTLFATALSLEAKSEHPLAKAILAARTTEAIEDVTDFTALAGNGLTAHQNGTTLLGGSLAFLSSKVVVSDTVKKQAEQYAQEGKTPLLFARNKQLLGIIAVADTIKPDSPKAIRELQAMGISVVMLTGDNARTAAAIGHQAGVDRVIAGVLPDGKERVVRELREYGKVVMVGDGINDAPALTRADVGIAIGAGADVAIDAADVVLMHSTLTDVAAAIRLSRATLLNIKENLFWAFCYNIIGIPLAAGCFVPFGLTLNPMFGAAAMSLSSFLVVSNALRLNLVRPHDASHDHCRKPAVVLPEAFGQNSEASHEEREASSSGDHATSKISTLHIEGMMCGHCEASVKEALEKLPGIETVTASHEQGTAIVTYHGELDRDQIKKAIEDEDFTFVSMD